MIIGLVPIIVIVPAAADSGSAVHASQQLQKQASMPYINNSAVNQHVGGSRLKATMEMSGERISGPTDTADTSNDGSSPAGDAALGDADDDVELEKSNILMLGPTGKCRCVLLVEAVVLLLILWLNRFWKHVCITAGVRYAGVELDSAYQLADIGLLTALSLFCLDSALNPEHTLAASWGIFEMQFKTSLASVFAACSLMLSHA